MPDWYKQVQQTISDATQKITGSADYRALHAIDEFAAADKLDEARFDQVGFDLMSAALEDLRARHLAFRRADKCEECDLEELRLQVLTAVTESPILLSYYREAWDPEGEPDPEAANDLPTSLAACRHIAVMQVELMVRAFSVLQLQRFANAPENQGWMILFRKWARSRRFNRILAEIKSTLPPEFGKFYDLYLYELPAFASFHQTLPIHHPWLMPHDAEQRRHFRGRGVYMDSGLMEGHIEIEIRPGGGGIVDARGPSRADQTFETPSDTGDDGGSEPSPNE